MRIPLLLPALFFTSVIVRIQASSSTNDFGVTVPSGISCDSHTEISWNASAMPSNTDNVDVNLLLADKKTVVHALQKSLPQSDPPVGFAILHPESGRLLAEKGQLFVIGVVAKDASGKVLGTGFSPTFSLPVCKASLPREDELTDDTAKDVHSHDDSVLKEEDWEHGVIFGKEEDDSSEDSDD